MTSAGPHFIAVYLLEPYALMWQRVGTFMHLLNRGGTLSSKENTEAGVACVFVGCVNVWGREGGVKCC